MAGSADAAAAAAWIAAASRLSATPDADASELLGIFHSATDKQTLISLPIQEPVSRLPPKLGSGLTVSCCATQGATLLHYACHEGCIAVIRACISEMGFSVTAEDLEGCQPIHVAAKRGMTAVIDTLILEFGVDPEAVSRVCANQTSMQTLSGDSCTSTTYAVWVYASVVCVSIWS